MTLIKNIFRFGSQCFPTGVKHPKNICKYCYNGEWNNKDMGDTIFDKVRIIQFDYKTIGKPCIEKSRTCKLIEGIFVWGEAK